MKVKDLRQYLAARDISTLACREKEELVDLVVQYLSSHSNSPFMVTVNNLDEAMADTPVSHRHDSVDRSVPHGSSYNQPGTRQSDPVRTDPSSMAGQGVSEILSRPDASRRPPGPNFKKPVTTQTCLAQKSIASHHKQVISQNYIEFTLL